MTRSRPRFFNTTGPCNPEDHYMLPPAERLQGAQLYRYVRDKLYWVLHAPRQTGKTTFLQTWMREINAGGEVVAAYVTVEGVRACTEMKDVMDGVCSAIQEAAKWQGLPVPDFPDIHPSNQVRRILSDWAERIQKPLVVLFDEVDTLRDDPLLTFLSQLRAAFLTRAPGMFPISIALVGMRDMKDYIITLKGGAEPTKPSPFNVKADSAFIGNFSKNDVARLFAQRTEETGQQITQEALDYAYDQSRGQPWIVNNLFMRTTMLVLKEDSTETVTLAHIREAREQMILARETHFDSLAHRLEDPRVRQIVESLLAGSSDQSLLDSPACSLCRDLGLVDIYDGEVQVSNPIYREVLARQMTYSPQYAIPKPAFRWQTADGSLDMDALLREFQAFWRENSEAWEQTSNYTEAFPHLLLMAFLQRITNGGGRIDREYAAGRGRLDLLVEYAAKRYIIEIKLLRDSQTPERVREQGLAQIQFYRDTAAPEAPAYLLIFDRRSPTKKLPWEQRITWETVSAAAASSPATPVTAPATVGSTATPSLAILGC